jgi:hypothetical protein
MSSAVKPTMASPAAGRMPRWFERLYFAPCQPAALAICRIWIYGYLLMNCLRMNYARWAEFPAELWEPVGVLAWLDAPPGPFELIWSWQTAYQIILLLCCLGFWFRIAAPAAFGMGLFLYALPNCFGKVDHSHTLAVFFLGILALSHAGRVWSVDAWLAAESRAAKPPATSSEYRWPVTLLQALMATVFMAAGIAKLRQSGLAWIFSDQLQNLLLDSYYVGREMPTDLARWIAQYPLLCQFAAGMTIVIELTAPLALFSRRYRWFVIPGLFGMQIGIYLVMGITFWQFLGLYVVWIDWNRLMDRLAGFHRRRRDRAPARHSPPATCPTTGDGSGRLGDRHSSADFDLHAFPFRRVDLQLVAQHQDVGRGLNPQPHLVPRNSHNRQHDGIAESHPLGFPPGKHQHEEPPCRSLIGFNGKLISRISLARACRHSGLPRTRGPRL